MGLSPAGRKDRHPHQHVGESSGPEWHQLGYCPCRCRPRPCCARTCLACPDDAGRRTYSPLLLSLAETWLTRCIRCSWRHTTCASCAATTHCYSFAGMLPILSLSRSVPVRCLHHFRRLTLNGGILILGGRRRPRRGLPVLRWPGPASPHMVAAYGRSTPASRDPPLVPWAAGGSTSNPRNGGCRGGGRCLSLGRARELGRQDRARPSGCFQALSRGLKTARTRMFLDAQTILF